MRPRVVVITYHAVERGPAPLCLDPSLFRAHLDVLDAAGVPSLTIAELGDAIRSGTLPERAVALTFDDGFESVAREAAPLLAERRRRATVFCVSGRLGGLNDWPTQPAGAPRRRLAGTEELSALERAGFEIGSHGLDHAPLHVLSPAQARREVVESKARLEQELGVSVRSFAYPYGALPAPGAQRLVAATYDAACITRLSAANSRSDALALPRIDAHYLRRPQILRLAIEGRLGPYLAARRAGARLRRTVRPDYEVSARLLESSG